MHATVSFIVTIVCPNICVSKKVWSPNSAGFRFTSILWSYLSINIKFEFVPVKMSSGVTTDDFVSQLRAEASTLVPVPDAVHIHIRILMYCLKLAGAFVRVFLSILQYTYGNLIFARPPKYFIVFRLCLPLDFCILFLFLRCLTVVLFLFFPRVLLIFNNGIFKNAFIPLSHLNITKNKY